MFFSVVWKLPRNVILKRWNSSFLPVLQQTLKKTHAVADFCLVLDSDGERGAVGDPRFREGLREPPFGDKSPDLGDEGELLRLWSRDWSPGERRQASFSRNPKLLSMLPSSSSSMALLLLAVVSVSSDSVICILSLLTISSFLWRNCDTWQATSSRL